MKCNIKNESSDFTRTDSEVKYDSICYQALCLAYAQCYKLEEDVIPIKDFNPKNKEHLFVYHIARATSGVAERQVAVKGHPIWCRKENKKIQVKGSKLVKYNKAYDEYAISPDTLLSALRPIAAEYFDEGFDFGEIYDAYYNEEENK